MNWLNVSIRRWSEHEALEIAEHVPRYYSEEIELWNSTILEEGEFNSFQLMVNTYSTCCITCPAARKLFPSHLVMNVKQEQAHGTSTAETGRFLLNGLFRTFDIFRYTPCILLHQTRSESHSSQNSAPHPLK